jgi:hypothetical protein
VSVSARRARGYLASSETRIVRENEDGAVGWLFIGIVLGIVLGIWAFFA